VPPCCCSASGSGRLRLRPVCGGVIARGRGTADRHDAAYRHPASPARRGSPSLCRRTPCGTPRSPRPRRRGQPAGRTGLRPARPTRAPPAAPTGPRTTSTGTPPMRWRVTSPTTQADSPSPVASAGRRMHPPCLTPCPSAHGTVRARAGSRSDEGARPVTPRAEIVTESRPGT
jgi:hypothetical protein